MSEHNPMELQPDELLQGHSDLAEMARSLTRTLQAAPAQESRRAAALRHYLIDVANSLANACDNATEPLDSEAHRAYSSLIHHIRLMSLEMSLPPLAVPPGIGTVMEAFAEKFMPDALLVLRPRRFLSYFFREHLGIFHEKRQKIPTPLPEPVTGLPAQFLVLDFPYGEQNNVLLSCNLLRAFGSDRSQKFLVSSIFATWTLGPAYFLAFVEDMRTTYPLNSAYHLVELCLISELLKSVGWLEHPQVGPLLVSVRKCFGFDEDYLQARLKDKAVLEKAQKAWQHYTSLAPAYSPADFDRDVPRLWERLQQLLPPNDLDIDAVESSQPADEVSILNAGWSFYLLHINDLYNILGCKTAEDRYEAKQVLNRLLTKGIELSSIARRWKEAREEGQP